MLKTGDSVHIDAIGSVGEATPLRYWKFVWVSFDCLWSGQ